MGAVLRAVETPSVVRASVGESLKCALEDSAIEVAAHFLFGRAALIPEMFVRLLRLWGRRAAPRSAA